jgi:hypothetical protein
MHMFVLHSMEIHVMDMIIGFQLPIVMDFMYMVYMHLEHVMLDIAHNRRDELSKNMINFYSHFILT